MPGFNVCVFIALFQGGFVATSVPQYNLVEHVNEAEGEKNEYFPKPN